MVEIHFKTFSPLAAASLWEVITGQSVPTGVVRSQVVRRGAVIRGVLSVQRSACHSSPQAAGSAGEWPVTTAAPAKVGALTQLLSLCAHRFHAPLPHLSLIRHRGPAQLGRRAHRRIRILGYLLQSRSIRDSQTLYNSSPTSDFSSFSSAIDASIFARLKSFIGSPSTISNFPLRTRNGNEEIKLFSTS